MFYLFQNIVKYNLFAINTISFKIIKIQVIHNSNDMSIKSKTVSNKKFVIEFIETGFE
jgi:hypothetical protein